MVQFRSLESNPEKRQIHQVVDSPTGPITIFEPTSEDVAAIMNMRDIVDYFTDEEPRTEGDIPINGVRVIRELYPRLTDIEGLDDLSDEEIQEIIDHPALHFMTVNQYIDTLIYQVYILMIATYKSNLELQRMEELAAEVSEKTMDMIVEAASKTDQGRGAISGITEHEEAIKKNAQQVLEDEKIAKENAKRPELKIVRPSYKEQLEQKMASRFEDVDQ